MIPMNCTIYIKIKYKVSFRTKTPPPPSKKTTKLVYPM